MEKLLIILAILFPITTLVAAYTYFCELVKRPKPVANSGEPVLRQLRAFIESNAADKEVVKSKLSPVSVSIKSFDGLTLRGYYIAAPAQTAKTVLCVHGYKSSAYGDYSSISLCLNELGYNVLLVDDRAHGESEGKYIGMGWLDRLDVLKWCDWLIDKHGESCEIALLGMSMGGAAVLNTAAESELPKQVVAVVSDCAFSRVEPQTPTLCKVEGSACYKKFMLWLCNIFIRLFAHYSIYDCSPINVVGKIKLPVLFIHGRTDDYVPFEMVNELYDACTSKKYLYVAENAWHACSYVSDNERYKAELCSFFEKVGF